MHKKDRFQGCLLGLAVGDAVGTTTEFKSRGSFALTTDMVGGGLFNLQVGEWTDDTSMALCLATSLLKSGGFDPKDQMDRYCRWQEDGYLSSNGRCFDIGDTVRSALNQYRENGNPFAGSTNPQSAGNGSIMRLAPIPMFYFKNSDNAEVFAAKSSRTTHAAEECTDSCRLLAGIIIRALSGCSKEEVLFAKKDDFKGAKNVISIAEGAYRNKCEDEIIGSGYVIKSLEAALWCFLHTDTYEAAILKAANLGEDADTTAAICGQVAGAFYGISGIPEKWQNRLVMKQEIGELAERLYEKALQTVY